MKALRDFVSREIKWTEELEAHLDRGTLIDSDEAHVRVSLYRPFVQVLTHYARVLTHRTYQQDRMFPIDGQWNNIVMCFVAGNRLDFALIATDCLPNYAIFSLDPVQAASRFRYDESGNRVDNITDWALKQFTTHYKAAETSAASSASGIGSKAEGGPRKITKEAIFHYCYAVLHDPWYREKYAQNLKREFPRIPFYADFWRWADWGAQLMALHIGYEAVAPFALARTDEPDARARASGQSLKVVLKADAAAGSIVLDSETTLRGVPPEAWAYKLGNRSAIDWVLDQHKEKKPKDPTIREHFNTYRFADYKEKVVDLLMRVTTVSVETVRITEAMRHVAR